MSDKKKSGKSLVEMIELLDKKAREQGLITFGEKGYDDYQKAINLLDSMKNKEEDFILLSGEMNAYLG